MVTDQTIDLITVGLTTLDVAVKSVTRLPAADEGELVEAITLSPAGTAGGTAAIAARLGLHVSLVSALGNDPQGDTVAAMLSREGVDLAMVPRLDSMPTSTTVLPLAPDGGRPTLHMIGASVAAPIPEAAFAALPRTHAVHFGGVGFPGPQNNGAAFLEAARQEGAHTTCDLISPGPDTLEHLADLLPHIDLFMPSLAEVRALLGNEVDLASAAKQFQAMGAGSCLFKLGRDGAALYTEDTAISVGAFAIDAIDTTSCGDALCAGYHVGRTRGVKGRDLLRFASATAACVAMGLGTWGTLDGPQSVLDLIDRQGVS